MKQYDIVTLTNLTAEYKKNNLYKNVKGVVIQIFPYDRILVLFFNDNIQGDYAVVNVNKYDLEKENIKISNEILSKFNNLNIEKITKKQEFKKIELKECDFVELIAENEKYSKYGIHKGDTGVIASDFAIKNFVLVDFSRVDKNGQYFGECIQVNICDLKKLQ